MNVIGYARRSLQGDDANTSITVQTEAIEEYCARRKCTLIRIEKDEHHSATKLRLNRPGLQRALAACKAGEAAAILVWRTDRLARSAKDILDILEMGVQLISCTEEINTVTPTGRGMLTIGQVFAGLEADATAERVKASIDHKRKAGRFAGGVVPYGYRPADNPHGDGRVLVIDPTEAAAVRQAAADILGGRSLYAVTLGLNASGPPPRRKGVRWSTGAVKSVLTGDAILGRVTHQKDVLRDETGVPRVIWDPILELDTVLQLRAQYPREHRGGTRRLRADELLSGLLVCGGCGANLHYRSRGNQPTGPQYSCGSSSRGHPCPRRVGILAETADTHVYDEYMEAFGDIEAYRIERVEGANLELIELDDALRSAGERIAKPGADVPALAALISDLQTRRAVAAAKPLRATERTVYLDHTIGQAWAEQTILERRNMLAQQIEGGKITVVPSTPETRTAAERLVWKWV